MELTFSHFVYIDFAQYGFQSMIKYGTELVYAIMPFIIVSFFFSNQILFISGGVLKSQACKVRSSAYTEEASAFYRKSQHNCINSHFLDINLFSCELSSEEMLIHLILLWNILNDILKFEVMAFYTF